MILEELGELRCELKINHIDVGRFKSMRILEFLEK